MTHTPFKPAWWLKNRHLQTCYPTLFGKKMKLPLREEIFVLSDQSTIKIHWTEPKTQSLPLLILLHGMGGSSSAPYIQRMMQQAKTHGFQAACVHVRTNVGLIAKVSHGGFTQDVEEVIQHLLGSKDKSQPLFVVGYSLGGSVLLNWLSQSPVAKHICAASVVSVPFDLFNSVQNLNKGVSKIYQNVLLKYLKFMAKNEFNIKEDYQTIYDFDDKVTAKLSGFKSALDYYQQASSKSALKNIHTQTLIIHAQDDPFLSHTALPLQSQLPPCIKLEVTQHGGHVGFVGGHIPFRPKYWLEERILSYFLSYLKTGDP